MRIPVKSEFRPFLSTKFLTTFLGVALECDTPVVEAIMSGFYKKKTNLVKADTINKVLGFLEARGWRARIFRGIVIDTTLKTLHNHFFDFSGDAPRPLHIETGNCEDYTVELKIRPRYLELDFPVEGTAALQTLEFPFHPLKPIRYFRSKNRDWKVRQWEPLLEILLKRDAERRSEKNVKAISLFTIRPFLAPN
jgi:hypothetical protein